MKNALIIWGGWDGHTPKVLADKLAEELEELDYNMSVTCNIGILLNDLTKFDILIPIWSCGINGKHYLGKLLEAVRSGVGLATFHGGIKWFEDDRYYEMIGGFYLYDTNPEKYMIKIKDKNHVVTAGIDDFEVVSEKYYLMTDPRNEVLAYSNFSGSKMPVSWVKSYGKGKVFYSTLAHTADQIFVKSNMEMFINGIKWVSS